MNRLRTTAALLLLLSGCASGLSREFSVQVDPTITFAMVQADPDAFAGKLLKLGGTIDQTIEVKGGTLIDVIQKPLDYWDKPRRTRSTGGHFFALHPGRLDPLMYAAGREITIGAEVAGTREAALPDQATGYPVFIVKEMKVWEREPRSWTQPQWLDPLYDPGTSGRHDW